MNGGIFRRGAAGSEREHCDREHRYRHQYGKPARDAYHRIRVTRHCTGSIAAHMESGLWIFILEAAVALAIAILIVWWTLPKKKRDDD